MAPENPKEDLSFGHVAVDKGYVTEEQVREALEIQSKLRSMGIRPKRLGEVLLERAYITREQSEDILAAQKALDEKRSIPGYEITGVLGRGGMGTVYRAMQTSMNRPVALKVLASRHARNRSFIERFVREARAVAKLNHENIVAGIDVGEADGLYYFAMEFVEGETVADMIARKGALPESRAVEIVLQMARALQHAHRNNLVHRDIKPQNIIVTPKGIAKLCDLGLAKTEDSEAHITRMGVSVGTPHYISPEQAKGSVDVDIRSDIYSLGATLYHMVVGEVPFVGSSPMVVMTKHLSSPLPFPSEKNRAVSVNLSRVICKMMEKPVEERYQTPDEVLGDLQRVSEGLPPALAGRRKSSARLARESRRRPGSRVALAVAPSRRRSGRRSRRDEGRERSGSGRYGPGRGGMAPAARASSVRVHTHHENVMLVVFIVAVIFMFAFAMLMGYVSSGEAIIEKIDFGKYEVEKKHLAASKALGQARAFDRANPYDDKEVVAAKYQEVVDRFPGTEAAGEAARLRDQAMGRRR
jgi:serine/threonine protein kinase